MADLISNPSLRESPSQTAGPYVHIGCAPNICGIRGIYATDLGAEMLKDDTPGQRITVSGYIFDAAGAPLLDAMIELWQADHLGRYGGPDFFGWGRQMCDFTTGEFRFETIMPGSTGRDREVYNAPHLSFWIVARGINIGLNTRMYFPTQDNSTDPVLKLVEPARRQTLIAEETDTHYRFDIHLGGDGETVFFDI